MLGLCWARHCTSISDVADDYIASVTQKNPKQKADTLRLLRDVVGTSSKKDASRAAAALLPTLTKVAGEPAPDIREAALQVNDLHGQDRRFVHVCGDNLKLGLACAKRKAGGPPASAAFESTQNLCNSSYCEGLPLLTNAV